MKKKLFFLMISFFFLLSYSITYRNCTHSGGTITDCVEVVWDPKKALIPCSLLPKNYSYCTAIGLDKFKKFFPEEDIVLPTDGCDGDFSNINKFGVGVCQPAEGIECIGERYWIANDVRCFKDGTNSYITLLSCSVFFGIFGADRFILGDPLLGTIKLCSLGGVLIWYFIDIIFVALGKLSPMSGTFKVSY